MPIRPIDIVKAERDHVLRAEAKTRKKEEHGTVAQADSGPLVVHGQHALDVLGRQARRKRRILPLRRCGGRRLQSRSAGTSEHEKPEERADGDRGQLAARVVSPCGFLADKGRDLCRGE